MVAEAGGWAWSSDRVTAGIQDAPGWLDFAAALTLFNRTMATARTAYETVVLRGGSGKSDSVISGNLASRTPLRGGEPIKEWRTHSD